MEAMSTRSLVLLSLAFLALACSSDEEEVAPSSGSSVEAGSLIERATHAMEGLTSFRMEFAFKSNEPAVPFFVDYSDPGDWYERFQAPESGQAFEVILLGDKRYERGCQIYPDECEPWPQEEARGEGDTVPSSAGLTTTAPATLGLTTLEHIENSQVIEADADSLIHVGGSVRLGKVILENKRKAYGEVEEYERSCRSGDVAPGNLTPSLTCTYTSFEEYVVVEYADADFDAEPATPVHVWISSDDFHVHRVVIGLPGAQVGNEPSESERYFEVSYSRFNEVTIEAPE